MKVKFYFFILMPALFFCSFSCLNFMPELKVREEQDLIFDKIKKDSDIVLTTLLADIQAYNFFDKINQVPEKIKDKELDEIKNRLSQTGESAEDKKKYLEILNKNYRIDKSGKNYELKNSLWLSNDLKGKTNSELNRIMIERKKTADALICANYLKSKYDKIKNHGLLKDYGIPVFFFGVSRKEESYKIKQGLNYGLIYKNEKKNLVIFAFRGSITGQDWSNDFRFKNSGQFAMTCLYKKIDKDKFIKVLNMLAEQKRDKDKELLEANYKIGKLNCILNIRTSGTGAPIYSPENKQLLDPVYETPYTVEKIFNILTSLELPDYEKTKIFPEIKVENGFFITYNTFRDNLFDILKNKQDYKIKNVEEKDIDITKLIDKNTKIYITGHSLGSASAYLFAVDYFHNLSGKNKDINVITFASPRVGNKEFVQYYSDNIMSLKNNSNDKINSIRIANCLDSITQVPMSDTFGFSYDHVNHEYCILFECDRKYSFMMKIPVSKKNLVFQLNTPRWINSKGDVHYQENYFQALDYILSGNTSYENYPELQRQKITVFSSPVSNNYLDEKIGKKNLEKIISGIRDADDKKLIMQYYNKLDITGLNYLLDKKIYMKDDEVKILKSIISKLKDDDKELISNLFVQKNKLKNEYHYILNKKIGVNDRIPCEKFLGIINNINNDKEKEFLNKYIKPASKNKKSGKVPYYTLEAKPGIDAEIIDKISKLLNLRQQNQLINNAKDK